MFLLDKSHLLVVKGDGGWQISDGARQLPLLMGDSGAGFEHGQKISQDSHQDDGPVDTGLGSGQVSYGLGELQEGGEKPDDAPEKIRDDSPQIKDEPVESGCKSLSDKSDRNGQCRKVSDSLSSSINNNKKLIKYFNNTTKQTRKNSGFDPPTGTGTAASTARVLDDGLDDTASKNGIEQEVLKAYSDCGIRLNRRTRKLAKVISADDVWRAYKELYNQGRHKETGILIHILEEYAARVERGESYEGSRYAEWEIG